MRMLSSARQPKLTDAAGRGRCSKKTAYVKMHFANFMLS